MAIRHVWPVANWLDNAVLYGVSVCTQTFALKFENWPLVYLLPWLQPRPPRPGISRRTRWWQRRRRRWQSTRPDLKRWRRSATSFFRSSPSIFLIIKIICYCILHWGFFCDTLIWWKNVWQHTQVQKEDQNDEKNTFLIRNLWQLNIWWCHTKKCSSVMWHAGWETPL